MRFNHASLRALRLARELSVGDLARLAGINPSSVSNLEAARPGHKASWAMVKRLAEVLDVPPLALAAPDQDPTFASWPAATPRRGGTKTIAVAS